jgi:uncharacterized protein (TIGR00369 family)
VDVLTRSVTIEELNARSPGYLPGLVGLEIVELGEGRLRCRLELRQELMATNGFLAAGSVVTLADTSCGYGTLAHLPEGATGWTTIELKTNLIGTARAGTVECEATLVHGGRSTQVWDARVHDASGRTIALFRCTQMLLYPKGT